MTTITLQCQNCGNDFQYDPKTFAAIAAMSGKDELSVPKKCPKCIDERQKRPATAVVKDRKLLHEFPAVAIKLPTEFFAQFKTPHSKDMPCLRGIFKGNDLDEGHRWSGRLDIYVLATQVPAVARVRVMEVEHQQGQKRTERVKDVERAVPGVSLSHPGQPKISIEVQYPAAYRYVVLEPTDSEPTAALVMPSVYRKTTLKGFGRQFSASLNTSEALWAIELSAEARNTGRFGTYGTIAVVDDIHPVETQQSGDVKSHRRYTLKYPLGEDVAVT